MIYDRTSQPPQFIQYNNGTGFINNVTTFMGSQTVDKHGIGQEFHIVAFFFILAQMHECLTHAECKFYSYPIPDVS